MALTPGAPVLLTGAPVSREEEWPGSPSRKELGRPLSGRGQVPIRLGGALIYPRLVVGVRGAVGPTGPSGGCDPCATAKRPAE